METTEKINQTEIKNPFVIPGIKELKVESNLNISNSFGNFVEGECNNKARWAGKTIAKNPGNFNPLLIYGNHGTGKTHLAQAIGIEIRDRYPEKKVLYVNLSQFISQFISAVRRNNRDDFVRFYQLCDVLILDDIDEFEGSEKLQDSAFYIFDYLLQNSGQIILTCNKIPAELQSIDQKLLSRFKWGLSVEITKPDYDTRMAILKQKCKNHETDIPDAILDYIASHFTEDIREFEGILLSILFQSFKNKQEITFLSAKNIIDNLIKDSKKSLSIDYIQKVICDYFGTTSEIIQEKTRKREIVQTRQIAMYFSKKLTKASLATIGMKIGGKDHATVLHACKTVDNLRETDKIFNFQIEEIEKKFKS